MQQVSLFLKIYGAVWFRWYILCIPVNMKSQFLLCIICYLISMYSCAGHSTPPLQLLHIAMLFVIAALRPRSISLSFLVCLPGSLAYVKHSFLFSQYMWIRMVPIYHRIVLTEMVETDGTILSKTCNIQMILHNSWNVWCISATDYTLSDCELKLPVN